MNKQIEEMAKVLCNNCAGKESPCTVAKSGAMCKSIQREAEALYNAGYRKQSEGEWFIREYEYFTCSECGHDHYTGCEYTKQAKERLENGEYPNYCHNCGAKMKGGAE